MQKHTAHIRQHYLDLHRSGRGHFFDDAKRIWLDMADQIETGKRSACVEAAFLASVPLVGSELYETLRALELKDWTKFAKAMLESITEGAAVVLGMAATGAAGGAALGAIGFVPGMAFGAVSGFTVGASAGIALMTSVGAIGVMQYFDATLPVILACYKKGIDLSWGKWHIAGSTDIAGGARAFAKGHALLFVGLLMVTLTLLGGKAGAAVPLELNQVVMNNPRIAIVKRWMDKNTDKLDALKQKLTIKQAELVEQPSSGGGSKSETRPVISKEEMPKRGMAQNGGQSSKAEAVTPKQIKNDLERRILETDNVGKLSPGAVLRQKHSNLTSQERQTIINDRLEKLASDRLTKLEQSIPGAHFQGRHGAQTTLTQQYDRAVSGVDPITGQVRYRADGSLVTPNSSKFMSARDQINAIERATNIYEGTGSKVLAERPIDFKAQSGEGYYGGTGLYDTSYSAQVWFNRSRQPITEFPILGK